MPECQSVSSRTLCHGIPQTWVDVYVDTFSCRLCGMHTVDILTSDGEGQEGRISLRDYIRSYCSDCSRVQAYMQSSKVSLSAMKG